MSDSGDYKTRRRAAMVNWYHPPRLISTAIRVLIATIFGEFADRREAMANATAGDAEDKIDTHCDYSAAEGDFWFDYVADTGDGWNSTYAVARLLAEDQLDFPGYTLPRGCLLVMGGDQVYPTASRLDYAIRLVEPFKIAARGRWLPQDRPAVFAIPGNHDWYDGLSAFMGLFCSRRIGQGVFQNRGRVVTERQTYQTRSYFALKLPNGYWLWGLDIQLAGYVDQPQVGFFDHVATDWMEPNSKLILCVGEPSWSHRDTAERGSEQASRFKNFAFMEDRAIGKGHNVVLVLTGDSHHFAHFTEGDCHYLTAGGGGAFLHPTQQMPDQVDVQSAYPGGAQPRRSGPGVSYSRQFKLSTRGGTGAECLFPDRATSRELTRGNVLFAWHNLAFTATIVLLMGIFSWIMVSNAKVSGGNLPSMLADASKSGLFASIGQYLYMSLVTPWPAILTTLAFGGDYYFADFKPAWKRACAGLLHGLAQATAFVSLSIGVATVVANTDFPNLWFIVLAGVLGGCVSSTLVGIYLYICLNGFNRHYNEAFSALRIEGYKNFLRIRIRADKRLEVYPIGLRKVPKDDRRDPPENPPLHPELIEPPIVI